MLDRAVGVAKAVVERVLGGEERDDLRSRHVAAEVRDEMPQVVFFLRADGAVGQEDVDVAPRERADGVVGVDPRVHARAAPEARAGRAQLDRNDVRVAVERVEQRSAHLLCFTL